MNDFLTEEECEALIAKASSGLTQQVCDGRSKTGKRTSSGVVCENDEVPGFRQRISALTNQSAGQLQHLKISKYEVLSCCVPSLGVSSRCPPQAGEEFTLHTDAIVCHKSLCSREDFFGGATISAAVHSRCWFQMHTRRRKATTYHSRATIGS